MLRMTQCGLTFHNRVGPVPPVTSVMRSMTYVLWNVNCTADDR